MQQRSMEEENLQLKETIQRQEYSLSTLENEKQDLVNDIEVAKATVSPVYVIHSKRQGNTTQQKGKATHNSLPKKNWVPQLGFKPT